MSETFEKLKRQSDINSSLCGCFFSHLGAKGLLVLSTKIPVYYINDHVISSSLVRYQISLSQTLILVL